MGGDENGDIAVQPVVRPEVVTFRRQKLDWPAVVTGREGENVTIQLLNKAKSEKVVKESAVKPFVMADIPSKRSELRRAFEDAQKLITGQ